MKPIRVSITLPAPPDQVWTDLAHIEDHVEWMRDAESIEFRSETHRGTGTTISVLTRIGPFRTRDEMQFTAWEPPRLMAVEHRGLFRGTGRFVLAPVPEGTRFTWEEDVVFPWYLGGPVGALAARPVLTAIWRGNLRRLAARFGAEGATAAGSR